MKTQIAANKDSGCTIHDAGFMMQETGCRIQKSNDPILAFPFKGEGILQTYTSHFEEDISFPSPEGTDRPGRFLSQQKISETEKGIKEVRQGEN